MKRSEFRAHFDADPMDSYAHFDRSGNASIGMPYPTAVVARDLINYTPVVELEIGFHRHATSAAPLKTLLLGWKRSIKRLAMQDFRFQPNKEIGLLTGETEFFGELKNLYELQITQLPVSVGFLTQLATLKKLRNLFLSCTKLDASSIEAIARSTSIKEVWLVNCEGVSREHEDILVNAGMPSKNVRVNRTFGEN